MKSNIPEREKEFADIALPQLSNSGYKPNKELLAELVKAFHDLEWYLHEYEKEAEIRKMLNVKC